MAQLSKAPSPVTMYRPLYGPGVGVGIGIGGEGGGIPAPYPQIGLGVIQGGIPLGLPSLTQLRQFLSNPVFVIPVAQPPAPPPSGPGPGPPSGPGPQPSPAPRPAPSGPGPQPTPPPPPRPFGQPLEIIAPRSLPTPQPQPNIPPPPRPPGPQPTDFTKPPPPPPPPPQPIPTLDQQKECLTCDSDRRKFTQQREQLTKSIQTEQSQQRQKTAEQQAQQLQQYTQQEQQPAAQRDIASELQSKYQLLSQLNSEIAQLTTQNLPQGSPQTSFPTSPQGQLPGEIPTLLPEQPSPTTPTPLTPTLPRPAPQQGVTFCVGCKSEEDAILFLNGEPAECSVIPGSTQPLALPQSEILPVNQSPAAGIDPRVDSLGSRIIDAIHRIGSTIGKEVCAHPIVLRAAFEAPVAALVAGLVAECPPCAVAAAALGQRLVDSGIDDFNSRYCHG